MNPPVVMRLSKAPMKAVSLALLTACALFSAAQAQPGRPLDPKRFAKFIGEVAFQANVGAEVNRLCPVPAPATAPLSAEKQVRETLQREAPDALKLLDGALVATRPAAEKYTPDLIKQAGGCQGGQMKVLRDKLDEQEATLMLRWMQGDF